MTLTPSRCFAMAIFFGFLGLGGTALPGENSNFRGTLIFSVKTWEGEYSSKDKPGGVILTPTQGAIYTLDIGEKPKLLVRSGKLDDFPAFTPDGQWVLYQSNASGNWKIHRCRPDGTHNTIVSAGDRLGKEWKDAYGFALSGDGKKMVYTVHNGAIGKVVVAKADGSEPKFVAPRLGYIYMAALSPNADRVVFSGPAAGYRLKMAKLPEGEVVDLTPNHPESFVPRFTPDGKVIVFLRRDGDIYSIGSDGKDLHQLTRGNKYVEFRLSKEDRHGSTDGPDISPAGKRIAFISAKNGVPNVWTMNVDGSQQKQITFRKSPCGRVKWSKDGKLLAFVSFEGPHLQLFVVPAQGGRERQLTHFKGSVYFVNWKH